MSVNSKTFESILCNSFGFSLQHACLRCFVTPFITENQILLIMRDRDGKISSQKHVKLNSALRLLRFLDIKKHLKS